MKILSFTHPEVVQTCMSFFLLLNTTEQTSNSSSKYLALCSAEGHKQDFEKWGAACIGNYARG